MMLAFSTCYSLYATRCVVMLVILLLKLLVGMFGATFSQVQKEATLEWRQQLARSIINLEKVRRVYLAIYRRGYNHQLEKVRRVVVVSCIDQPSSRRCVLSRAPSALARASGTTASTITCCCTCDRSSGPRKTAMRTASSAARRCGGAAGRRWRVWPSSTSRTRARTASNAASRRCGRAGGRWRAWRAWRKPADHDDQSGSKPEKVRVFYQHVSHAGHLL